MALKNAESMKQRQASSGRKRSTTDGKRRKRMQELIEAATRVLAEEGPERFSMNRVAAAASVRLSGLQYYFPTRNALIWGMLAAILEKDKVAIAAAIAQETLAPKERLRRAVDAYMANCETVLMTKVCLYFFNTALYDEELMAYLDDWYLAYMRIFTELIQSVNQSVSEKRGAQMAAIILALVDGAAIMRHSGPARQAALQQFLPSVKKLILELVLQQASR
jgi:AcrR family transcriptional regulator